MMNTSRSLVALFVAAGLCMAGGVSAKTQTMSKEARDAASVAGISANMAAADKCADSGPTNATGGVKRGVLPPDTGLAQCVDPAAPFAQPGHRWNVGLSSTGESAARRSS